MIEEKLQKRKDNAKIKKSIKTLEEVLESGYLEPNILDIVETAMFLLENTQPTVGRYNG